MARSSPDAGSATAMLGRSCVIGAVFERDDDVQPIHAAALKDHDQDFAAPLCSAPAARTRNAGGKPNARKPMPADLRNERREPSMFTSFEIPARRAATRRRLSSSVSANAARVAGESESGAIKSDERLRVAQRVRLHARAVEAIADQIGGEVHAREQHVRADP